MNSLSAELDRSELSDLLSCDGHVLVLGGPGSGKTTSALIKADDCIRHRDWSSGREVLFLSFARSTVARVAEAAGSVLDKESLNRVELTTYHGFMWRLLKSHGYLLHDARALRLLPPHEAAARLADATKNCDKADVDSAKESEIQRLLNEESLLHFDLFSELAANLLEQSDRLCGILSRRYPVVVLDEFQDTNAGEYRFIQAMARHSQIIALADPDQRIYEFRGADPKRIQEFTKDISPLVVDLETRNHRSNGTDILEFANDLLTQSTGEYDYEDVCIKTYPTRKGAAQHIRLKVQLIEAIKRLKDNGPAWSIGVLVPTQKMMCVASDCLSARQNVGGRVLPGINHDVAVDAEGPSLAGVLIARLLERSDVTVNSIVADLCKHIIGRKGRRQPSKAEVRLINGIREFESKGKVRGAKRQRVIADCERIVSELLDAEFTGDPYADWVTVRDMLESSKSSELQTVAADARYLRFLGKGARLRLKLSSAWREHGTYVGAAKAVESAYIQEHFAAISRKPSGIHVMTIHKSKGKEFDEVIIYEGVYGDRINGKPDDDRRAAQARLALRVAVSRAKKRVTILTPKDRPCELLT